jgi:transcriptional regulator with XRE-family HTH domain
MDERTAEIGKNLAANLSALRRQKKLTQAQLSKLAGLPRTTITLFESGSANPSVVSLLRVGAALQVSIEELLARPRPACMLFKSKDIETKTREGIRIRHLLPDPLPGAEIDEMVMEAGKVYPGSPHLPGTKEYFTCLQGEVTVKVAGESFAVGEGDVLAFEGHHPHSYRNSGRGRARSLSVIVLALST